MTNMENRFCTSRDEVVPFSIEDAYEKCPKLKKEDVEELKKWGQSKPHFPVIDEWFYMVALHGCIYNVEVTKSLIEKFLKFKSETPEFFKDADPISEPISAALDAACLGVLPTLTDKGHAIFYGKMVDTNVAFFNESCKIGISSITTFTHEMGLVKGFIGVFDCEGSSLWHLLQVSPMSIKKGLYFLQSIKECKPVRLVGVHFINVSGATEKIISAVKPLVPSGSFKFLQFHKGDSIFEHIPRRCLPYESGGTLCAIDELQDFFKDRMKANYEFIKKYEDLVIDESKIPQEEGYSFFGAIGRSLQGFSDSLMNSSDSVFV